MLPDGQVRALLLGADGRGTPPAQPLYELRAAMLRLVSAVYELGVEVLSSAHGVHLQPQPRKPAAEGSVQI